MEYREYRAQVAERKATLAGAVTAPAAGAIAWFTSNVDPAWLDTSAGLVATAGGVAVAAGQGHRKYRDTNRYIHHKRLTSNGWMTRTDLSVKGGHGVVAMRRMASKTRPDLTATQRWITAHPTELGIEVGRAISGSRAVRQIRKGARVYSSFEEGMLILGEPGRWKSSFLANQVLDHPGPALIASTKPEFWEACSELREQRGPVWLFDPTSPEQPAAEYRMRWNLVRGCRDVPVAQRRAQALMDADAASGLDNASFWQGRGRTLVTALLVAADYSGKTLRDVASWVQTESYSRPLEILEHAAAAQPIEASLLDTLRQFTNSGAKATSSSASQTASQVFEFLANPRLAASLCPAPDGTEFSPEEMLDQGGTLFLVTGESAVLAPIVSVLAAEVRDAAKARVRKLGLKRLAPPLALMYDEAHLTVAGVPVDTHAAELRGWGVYHLVATQNYAQMIKTWGDEAATVMATCLQTHLILGANDGGDRERFTKRVGMRKAKIVKEQMDAKGKVQSRSIEHTEVERWPAEAWSDLRPGQGVVIANSGRPAVVSVQNGLERAAKAREELARQRLADQAKDAVTSEVADKFAPAAEPKSAVAEEGTA